MICDTILIRGGRVVNPASGVDAVMDMKIADGIISAVGENLPADGADVVIEAAGRCVLPGFIDLHVHFRDPGQTHKEDIATGSAAAAAGGYTTVCAMPNVAPPADCGEAITYAHEKAAKIGLCRIFQVGAITHGMAGERLSDIEGMVNAGCMALSEDGKSVMDSALMRAAMKKAKRLGIPIFSHCEDISLVEGGVMNAGARAEALGLRGITNAVENIIAARDIMLAEETGAALHLCHCSTKETYELVRDAKRKGIRVTGEICPHHFTLTEDDIPDAADANYKMNPPLRTKADVKALIKGLREDVFDVISTDHAPHTDTEKAGGFVKAPFGIVGLETAAALTYTQLAESGVISLAQMVRKMSLNPARILGIDRGDISIGKAADVVIFDTEEEYGIRAADFKGKSHNMPYEGRRVKGRVCATIFDGRVVYRDGEIVGP